jgi:ribonuclease-3
MKTIQQLTDENRNRLQELEALLGYKFTDVTLLQQALVHSSFGFEKIYAGLNNETFEFLGDAVLDLAISDLLYKSYPGITEGELTKIRSGLVKEAALADMARRLNLGGYLMLGKGEEASQGREKSSILSSAFEALIGAIHLDTGYESALEFVRNHFSTLFHADLGESIANDPKSQLQEKLQEQFNRAPTYHLDDEKGPAHAKSFIVSVRFMEEVLGTGSGSSKKVAEQNAAQKALSTIDVWWDKVKDN